MDLVPNALRAAGWRVEVHADHFPPNCPDEEWIAGVAKRGWLILTKDKAVRRRPVEVFAIRAASAAAFILTAGDLSGAGQASAFIQAGEALLRLATKYTRPVIATVSRTGAVRVIEGERRGGVRRR